MASSRAQLVVLLDSSVRSGNSDTTAEDLRTYESEGIISFVNKNDDANVNGGFLSITSGRVDITFINKATPIGGTLRDDGTWGALVLPNAATSGRVVYATGANTYGESANLTFSGTRLSPNYITLSPGAVAAGSGPLVFTSSGNGITGLLTVAAAGTVEFSGYGLWMTSAAGTREKVYCGLVAQTAPNTQPIGTITDYYGTSATRVLTTPDTWISFTGDNGTVYRIPGYLAP